MKKNNEKKYWVRLSRACNNKCIFCLDSDSHNNTIYSYDDCINKIKSGFKSNAKFKQRLILSGGEPTLNSELIKIIKFAKEIGFDKIQIITNGRMFCYPKFIKSAKAAGLDEITFSIHGHTALLHDYLTGVKGSWKQTLAGLKNALKLNFIVNIDIVVNKQNFKHLLKMVKFFHSLGVSEFDLLTIMPYGRAWDKNFKKLFYNLDDFQIIFNKILKYAQQHDLVIWCNRFPANFFEGKEKMMGDIEKKLQQEIFSERQSGLEAFLKGCHKPRCFDKLRCKYCYLNDFCQQLFVFAEAINKTETSIIVFDQPFCISNKNYKKIDLKSLLLTGQLSLQKFFKCYLQNLHKYKSLRCKSCKAYKKCRGADYSLIAKKGFKILKPIL